MLACAGGIRFARVDLLCPLSCVWALSAVFAVLNSVCILPSSRVAQAVGMFHLQHLLCGQAVLQTCPTTCSVLWWRQQQQLLHVVSDGYLLVLWQDLRIYCLKCNTGYLT